MANERIDKIENHVHFLHTTVNKIKQDLHGMESRIELELKGLSN